MSTFEVRGDLMATLPILPILRRARELIADPAHWTRGAMARDRDGLALTGDPLRWRASAACFSAVGAIAAAAADFGRTGGEFTESAIWTACWFVQQEAFSPYPCDIHSLQMFVNDDPAKNHADILRLFDRTIARLSGPPIAPKPAGPQANA